VANLLGEYNYSIATPWKSDVMKPPSRFIMQIRFFTDPDITTHVCLAPSSFASLTGKEGFIQWIEKPTERSTTLSCHLVQGKYCDTATKGQLQNANGCPSLARHILELQ
jgi:hypothetical protein